MRGCGREASRLIRRCVRGLLVMHVRGTSRDELLLGGERGELIYQAR